MKGVLRLSWLHAWHHKAATGILISCLGLTALLPAATRVVVERYGEDLTARARATPLVLGPKGNRFDLTLGALYFSASSLDTVPYALVREIASEGDATPIPISNRFTARGRPILCTSPEYFALRGLTARTGTPPLRVGDATLGARAAEQLGLAVGDTLPSDPTALYDLSKPASFGLHITGIFEANGTADDEVIFSDVKTAWVLEGIAHGHAKTDELDNNLVVDRSAGNVALSGALIEHTEATPENLEDFHVHTGEDRLPLTAIIVLPRDDRADTILNTGFNLREKLQMVRPREVIDDLLTIVFSIRQLIDLISLVLGAATILLTVLVLMLSSKLRARERDTLHKIGCAPGAVARLLGYEILLVLGTSLILASVGTAAVARFAPSLTATMR